MSKDEKVKQLADGYIEAIYSAVIPPKQAIEVRLAFYGGMMAMLKASSEIANAESSEDDALTELAKMHAAIQSRALKLNEERSKP